MGLRQDIRTAIESRLSANWTTTDISWDNIPYTPLPETPYIRLLINEVDSYQASMAAIPCHRTIGLIHILIMTPVGTGTQTARGYADTLDGIFRNANFSDIICKSPKLVRVGDVGEHYQYSHITSFWIDKALANA